MSEPVLEHVNVTVSDVWKTAPMLSEIFGWEIRWDGEAIHGGYSIHIGSKNSYIAIYSGTKPTPSHEVSYDMNGGLNHIGVVVDDLEEIEKKVVAAGFTPHSHADYEPGKRFYFQDHDHIEFEVVSYETR